MTICLFANLCFSQFQRRDQNHIDYNDPVIVFKNALLIDGKAKWPNRIKP